MKFHSSNKSPWGILAALFLLLAAIVLFILYPFTEILSPVSVSDLTVFCDKDKDNVPQYSKIKFSALYYAGSNNTSKKKVTGDYYYTLSDGHCLFVLLKKTKNTPEPVIRDREITCRVLSDSSCIKKQTAVLSSALDWDKEALGDIVAPYLISEPDYHALPTILLAGLAGIVALCSLLHLIILIIKRRN